MKNSSRFLILLFVVIVLSSRCVSVYAHDKDEHNRELDAVLFGGSYSVKNQKEIKESIAAIKCASYLAIDQFQGEGEDAYEELKGYHVGGLPSKFSDLDYSYRKGDVAEDYSTNSNITSADNYLDEKKKNKKKITPKTHRVYTHQGWDRDYSSKGREIKKFWDTRRKVLLGTVNSVFKFDKVTLFGYSDRCNSMAGIIYYVHILGDYNAADNYDKVYFLPALAGRDNANDKDKDYDIITSLKSYIEILFSDQESTREYKKLITGLEDIEKKAAKIQKSVGGVNTKEEFLEYQQYTDATLELMSEYIPILLKNEEFFANKFYPKAY